MYRTGVNRFGFGNWIFLLATVHLFTFAQGGEESSAPLRLALEPLDAVAALGARVVLACSGAPGDLLAWRHAQRTPLLPEHTIPRHDANRQQAPNGSLVIVAMEEAAAGRYQCVATRPGVGTLLSRQARVTLAALPEMSRSGPRTVSAVAGGPLLLPCGLRAEPRAPPTLPQPPAERRRRPRPPAKAAPAPPPPPPLYLNVTWLQNGAPVRGQPPLSPSGALELDPVRAHHQGKYACRVSLPHQPHTYVTGDEIEVRVDSDMADAEFPPRFVATPQPATVLEGGTATFDCAAVGNPKPEIVWLHNGVAIDLSELDSRVFVWGVGSLVVSGARASDAGAYTCRAHSRLDSADHTAPLVTLTAPRVSLPDGAVAVARVRGDVTLRCDVRGRPSPAVTWYKDGEPLTPNNHDIALVDGSSLRIQGVLPLDAGVFQCAGDSAAGSALAAVRLAVRDDEPQTNTTTNKSPNPSATKEAPRITSQDILDSLISTLTDQGDPGSEDLDLGETSSAYTLKPEFGFGDESGSDSANYDLLDDYDGEGFDLGSSALPPANASLVSPPREVRAVVVKPRFVTLSWAPPGVAAVPLTGYLVVYRVRGSERERVSPCGPQQLTANVAGLQPNTSYAFSVLATAEGVSSPPAEAVTLVTPPEEVSWGPPRGVLVEALGPHALRVSWSPPEGRPGEGGQPDKYIVYYTEAESGREQLQWVSPLPAAVMSTSLGGLRAASAYWVRVAAAGGALSQELRVRTTGDVPAQPPHNVSATPTGDTSVVVTWEAPPPRTHRGPLTGYTVRYRPSAPTAPTAPGAGPASAPRRKPGTLTTPADARRAQLTNLEPGTTYQVRVCALNANGSGPYSEWVPVTTRRHQPPRPKERQVPAQPPPLTTRAGRDWISVWWSQSGSEGAEGADGAVGSYQLGWGLGVPDERTADLPHHLRSHVIRNLEPNSEYVISLRAGNSLGLGPPVYATVRTRPAAAEGDDLDEGEGEGDAEGEGEGDDEDLDETPPLIPPVGVKVIMLSGTTAVVYWTDPTLPKGQAATDGRRYVVRYSAVGSGGGGGRARTYNASDLNCMLDDLRPYTTYEFAVKLIKGGRESSWSMLVSNTSLEAAPASPPRELRASPPAAPANAARQADLAWAPPLRPNGLITGYVIMYAPAGTEQWAAVASSGAGTSARVGGLRARSSYLFKVQARNAKGLGPFCTPLQYTTHMESGDGGGLAWATSAWLWASAGGALAVLALAAALALSLCCRRAQPPLSPPTSTYQKSSASAGIKPPDLWIHHDQMELRHTDKALRDRDSHISAGSTEGALASSTLTLGGSGSGAGRAEYEPARRPPASLDRRTYVPTYVDRAGSVAGSEDAALLRASPASQTYYRCEYTHTPMTGMGVGSMGSMGTVGSMGAVGMMGVGGSCANTCERRAHPRPLHSDQSTPLLSCAPPGGPHHQQHPHPHHQHPLLHPLGSPGPPPGALGQTPPCGSSSCPLGAACGASGVGAGVGLGGGMRVGGDIYACAASARERGHYVAYEPLATYTHRDSLSSEGAPGSTLGGGGSVASAGAAPAAPGAPPPSLSCGGSLPRRPLHSFSDSDHSTPSHSHRSVRESSPYKKSNSSSPGHGHGANRLLQGGAVPHCASELEPLTPSRSTERLQREMVNLEGLMKDLSAITQHQFQC